MITKIMALGIVAALPLYGEGVSNDCVTVYAMHLYEPSPGSPTGAVEIKNEYGARTAGTIDVGMIGPGVEKRGIYHVAAASDIFDLLTQAGISKIFNGHILVNRRSGSQNRVVLRIEKMNDPALHEFRLQTGDVIFIGERLL